MGKYIKTQYFDTHESIMGLAEDLVQNPMYLYNDKKGIRVTWYNPNTEKSTLDPGSKMTYSQLGDESSIRYNRINGVYLYQFPKIEFNFEDDEFGMHNGPIEGESYILPNKFEPLDGAFFVVEHIKDSPWLFKVTSVQPDTFENGANAYKISFSLDRTTDRDILNNVVDTFEYIDVRDGDNLKAVVRSDKLERARTLDRLNTSLCTYFYELFYHNSVQTFIYHWYNNYQMYDPFAIEFMIHNRLMEPIQNIMYVTHMTVLGRAFSLDYARTFFRAFELKDKKLLQRSTRRSQADFISDMTSIFYSVFDDFFALNHKVLDVENGPLNPRGVITLIDDEFVERILTNSKYCCCTRRFLNIVISYFNNEDIWYPEIEVDLEQLLITEDKKEFDCIIFYYMLLTIFCIDNEIKKLLS